MGVAAERPLEATRDRLGARRGVLGVDLAAATVVLTLFAFGAVMLATLIAWPYVVGGLLVLATVPVRVMRLARPLPVLLVPLAGGAALILYVATNGAPNAGGS